MTIPQQSDYGIGGLIDPDQYFLGLITDNHDAIEAWNHIANTLLNPEYREVITRLRATEDGTGRLTEYATKWHRYGWIAPWDIQLTSSAAPSPSSRPPG